MSKTGFYKGRLGIGLTSTMGMGDGNPRYPLDINGDIRLTGAIVNSQGLALNMVNPDSAWVVDAANNIISYTAGNVGIGTESPSAYLHVRSTDDIANYAVPQVLITADPASNYNQYASLELRGTYIGNTVPYGVGIRSRYGHDSSYRTYGDFSIYTSDRDNGNARTDRLTVTSTGNVAIGTTSPLTNVKLSIVGNSGATSNLAIRNTNATTTSFFYIQMNDDGKSYVLNGTNNPLSLGTNNQERICILGNGNVGIGTTSPGAPLEIKCTAGGNSHNTQWTGAKGLRLTRSVDGHAWEIVNGYHNDLLFRNMKSDGTVYRDNVLMLDDNGNVGIGTASPKERLDVGNGKICFQGGTFGGTCGISYYHGTQSTERPVILFDSGGSTIIRSTDNNSTDGIRFQNYGGSDRMFIRDDGNVGIGTTSPEYPLQVGNLGAGGNAYSETKHNRIAFPSHSHSNNRYLFANRDPDGNTACLDLHFVHNTSSNNKHIMTFNNFGNVGIGTTSPQTKLDVTGDYSKDGEIISMTCQYGLNAKSSIFNDWFREEHSNWGLYWINASSDFDYETIMAYHATTDTSFAPTTGVTMSQFMSNYPPGDNGENIGSCSYTHGSYTHTTFPISAGRKYNYYSYSTIRTDADAWSEQPYRASGDATNVMYTGYIKCNETATYYFGWYAFHYYRGLLFIQNPNEGTGKAWNFGYPGWQGNFQCRTNGVDMTAGKYYKFTFLMKGSGYYYYQGAIGMLGWSQSSANWSNPGNYYGAHVHSVGGSGYLNSTRSIDSVSNWQTRFGWISDDSPLQFVKRIPN